MDSTIFDCCPLGIYGMIDRKMVDLANPACDIAIVFRHNSSDHFTSRFCYNTRTKEVFEFCCIIGTLTLWKDAPLDKFIKPFDDYLSGDIEIAKILSYELS